MMMDNDDAQMTTRPVPSSNTNPISDIFVEESVNPGSERNRFKVTHNYVSIRGRHRDLLQVLVNIPSRFIRT